jgi:hypothetical protein
MKEKTTKQERGKYVREIWPEGTLWCDQCRVFTDDPAKHQHDMPLY